MLITETAIAIGHKVATDEQRRTLRTRKWYLAFQSRGFTPRQSKRIAGRMTHNVKEVRDMLGDENFDIMARRARP